jgi:hypothetical protein
MMTDDKNAAFKLLETGTLVDFQVLKTEIIVKQDGTVMLETRGSW